MVQVRVVGAVRVAEVWMVGAVRLLGVWVVVGARCACAAGHGACAASEGPRSHSRTQSLRRRGMHTCCVAHRPHTHQQCRCALKGLSPKRPQPQVKGEQWSSWHTVCVKHNVDEASW